MANRVRDAADTEWIRESLQPQGVEVAGVVPYDTDVSLADRKLSSLLDVAPQSAAASAIADLAGVIAREVGAAPTAVEVSGNGKAGDDGCPWVVDAYR